MSLVKFARSPVQIPRFAKGEAKYDFPKVVMKPECTQKECFDTVASEP